MKMNLFNLLSFCLLRVFYLGSATVSNSFKDCSQFFYMQTPPAGIRGSNLKWICQTYGDKQRYATLYDCSRRLPLYSAYVFKKSDGQRRVDTPWMFEPQVERTRQVFVQRSKENHIFDKTVQHFLFSWNNIFSKK